MKNLNNGSKPATEVVSVVYKSKFWKFFFSFLFIIVSVIGFYLVWAGSGDSDVVGEDAAVVDNSFFSSVGSDTKEALSRCLSFSFKNCEYYFRYSRTPPWSCR